MRATRTIQGLLACVVLGAASQARAADLKPATLAAWGIYVERAEQRIGTELNSDNPFLVVDRLGEADRRRAANDLRAGRVFMINLRSPVLSGSSKDPPDGLIHHWLGAARIPGATVDTVLAFVQRYDDHARFFEDVVESKLVSRDGDRFQVFLRLRRKKIVTVTYNTTHDVVYRRHDERRASSRSIATRIAELDKPGQAGEREKPPGRDSGYLWRLNSYWRFIENGDGVTIECESLTLSRDIPFGFGWLVRPMVEDISRESLERTLSSIRLGVAGTPVPPSPASPR